MWTYRFLTAGCLASVLAALAPAPAGAQKDLASCKPVLDAEAKALTTPNHAYLTTRVSGNASNAETVTTRDTRYLKVNGKWRRMPYDPKAEWARTQANIQSAKAYSCRPVRAETVNGVATTVYNVHSVTDAGTVDGQVWIADGTRLPVRENTQLGIDSSVSVRIDYTDVRPPAGAQ